MCRGFYANKIILYLMRPNNHGKKLQVSQYKSSENDVKAEILRQSYCHSVTNEGRKVPVNHNLLNGLYHKFISGLMNIQ